jgi:hypothetical protein
VDLAQGQELVTFTARRPDMTRRALTTLTTLTGAALLSSALLSAQSGPYAKVTEIKIGGQGGHDYLAVDPGTRRLFISNSTQMVVIDIDKNAVVGTIADTPRVHGIAFTPAGKGFTSNGGENKASIVDMKTLAVSGKAEEQRDLRVQPLGRHGDGGQGRHGCDGGDDQALGRIGRDGRRGPRARTRLRQHRSQQHDRRD